MKKNMKKNWFLMAMLFVFAIFLAGCTQGNAIEGGEPDDVIDIVWYPNESGNELKASRDAIGEVVDRKSVV